MQTCMHVICTLIDLYQSGGEGVSDCLLKSKCAFLLNFLMA